MNVEEPAGESMNEIGAENAHEAGEHDETGSIRLHDLRQCRVIRGPVCVVARRENLGGDSEFLCLCQTCRVGAIADDSGDADRKPARLRGACNGQHVGAAAGDQDNDRQRRGSHQASITTPREPWRTSPMIAAACPACLSASIAASARSAGTVAVMPTPQLKVRYISASLTLPARCSHS